MGGTKVAIEPSPFGTLTMNEIAEQLIGEFGPMRIMEIVCRMKECGYRPQEDNQTTYNILRRSMTIERFNLTVRMTLRRFTRFTNVHSKSLKHHVAMQAFFVAWYNFCRKHEALKGHTPAMASGLVEKPWTIKELLEIAGVVALNR